MVAGSAEGLDVPRDQKRHVEKVEASATQPPLDMAIANQIPLMQSREAFICFVRALAREAARRDHNRKHG